MQAASRSTPLSTRNTCSRGDVSVGYDNQEVFFLLRGTAVMITGDWCQFPSRERCFEVGTMEPGSFSLIKPGNLHALFNVTDEDLSLLMFGGYD